MAAKISSTELYRKTRVRKLSETIKTRRISWYDHALRLPENTAAQIALTNSERKLKKYPREQMTTSKEKPGRTKCRSWCDKGDCA